MAIGDFQAGYLAIGKPKEAALFRKGKQWFFNLVLDCPDPAPAGEGGTLVMDLGKSNIAAISSGKILGGGAAPICAR